MKKRYFASIILLIICICSFFVSACVLLERNEITIKVGETYNWYQGEEFTYSSSKDNVAKIDEYGVITAISYGECKVYAKSSTQSKTLFVNVLKNALPSYPSSIHSSSYSSIKTQQTTSSLSSEISSRSSDFSSLPISSSETSSLSNISSSIVSSSSSQSSIISSSSSSSVLQIYFTLDTKGGTIEDANWLKSGANYITYVETSLPIPEKTGYSFVAWQNDNGVVETITKGGTAYAVWQEISYSVEYILTEGENDINNPSSYNYFDEPFVLQPATCQGKDFVGWFLNEDCTEQTFVIPNTKQKVTLYAKFSTLHTATFVYNGVEYSTTAEQGECFTKPDIQVDKGYFIEWFTESEYKNSYNFALKANDDITLYGKLYVELTGSFFDYENNKLTKVNNMTEFQYYLEYTFFNDITSGNSIEVSQEVYNTLTSASSQDLTLLFNKTTMPFISLSRTNWTSGGKYYYQVFTQSNIPDEFYTQTLSTLPQYDYAQVGQDKTFVATRASDFDNFKYYELEREVYVENSNQLFFALEHRIKPIPLANSNAEKALNKCKEILRNIISDEMSDIEKVLVLYRYLCYNVTYNMPSPSNSSDMLYYDAFYAEGVLNNNQAVCDGICKVLSLLCNIEGIRCVRTASTSHAWNEVFINGSWYTIDATHGNASVNGEFEILTHTNFLINESIKESLGYSDILRTDVIANGEYNYYKDNTFVYDNQVYDFVIESRNELTILLKWCNQQDKLYNYTNYTIDVIFDYSYYSFTTELSRAKSSAGLSGLSISYVSENYNGKNGYVLIIK